MKALLHAILIAFALTAAAASSANKAKPDYPALFAELEKAPHIAEGAKEPKSVLYVFFDPNCFYCQRTWKALQYYEKVGLQVRWVPVAFQKTSSEGRAAAIMEAKDPVAALRENKMNYKVASFDGGIKPKAKPGPTTLAAIRANTRLMLEKFGAPGTPALAWKDTDGQVHFKVGVPKLSELPGITGLPEQWIDDPELTEFR